MRPQSNACERLLKVSLIALGAVSVLTSSASAVPVVVDPTAGPLQIFDQGGILNQGYYMGGLEVSSTGQVYVAQSNNGPGGGSNTNRLIRSVGLSTATQIGPDYALGNAATRGNDLTLGPAGLYYVAVNGGVYGLDPLGVSPPALYASGGNITSTGVTFIGGTVYVSSDNPAGLQSASSGGTLSSVAVLGSNDDHVTTPGGTHYFIGDGSRSIRNVAGTVMFDLNSDADTSPLLASQGAGSRGAIDPVSGDIFMGYSFGGSNQAIFRVRSDFSDAVVFATGFGRNIRDFDFGPSSSGPAGAISLYVAVNDLATGVGTIYEIQTSVPEPSAMALAALGLMAISAVSWRRNKRRPQSPGSIER